MKNVISKNSIFQKSIETPVKINLASPVILVIDDSLDFLEIIVYALDLFGYNYYTAATAKQGLLIAEKQQPDAILLDIGMPEIKGLYVMELLRQNALTNKIPVVAMSIVADIQNRHFLLSKGFSDCLPKPFSLIKLKETLDRITQQ